MEVFCEQESTAPTQSTITVIKELASPPCEAKVSGVLASGVLEDRGCSEVLPKQKEFPGMGCRDSDRELGSGRCGLQS